MNDVKQIAQDSNISQVGRQRLTPTQESPPSGVEKDIRGMAQEGQDILDVDRARRDEAILEENAKLLLKELHDARPDRVAEAQARLQAGFYDRPEVLEETAQKIQEDLQATGADRGGRTLLTDQPKNADASPVDAARQRLAKGYYEQQEVLDETARRILNREL
jgi:hypothetical protein